MPECAVIGCMTPAATRGWCNTHYERWRRNGDAGEVGDARKRKVPRGPCSIEGCDNIEQHRGWCSTHYERWCRHGDPLVVKRPNYGSYRVTTGKNGYVRIYKPGHPLADSVGYVYEHRFVLYEAGVDIEGLHVHHKNGVKTDNRLENLEVLSNAEHGARHLDENRVVSNQYGTWAVRNRNH